MSQLANDVAAGDDAIYRVSGRRIMWSSITVDGIALVYTFVSMSFYFNIIRLNVYQPLMMNPFWTWAPYWRVYAPGLLMFLPPFLYFLVFYRRALLMMAYVCMSVLLIIYAAVCQCFLINDWVKNCATTLWCPCINGYNVVNGNITVVYCDPTNTSDASGVFIANFFLLLALWIMAIGMTGVAIWIHFQYYQRNNAYEANNPLRNISYNNINSQMGGDEEKGRSSSPPPSQKAANNNNGYGSGNGRQKGAKKGGPNLYSIMAKDS